MKVGIVQINTQNDKTKNLAAAEAGIDKLASDGADLICLPEMFNFLGTNEEMAANMETPEGMTLNRMREKARKQSVFIHCGSILTKVGEEVFNRTVVYNREGEEVACYNKIHLFDIEAPGGNVYRESDLVTPGSDIVTFDCEGVTVGLSICYDLRFPELYRRLSEKEASLILIPAAFTLMTGKDHWEPLIRARAIENICFVAAPGNWGPCPPNLHSWGHSMIVDPWGAVISQASDRETTILAELCFDHMNTIREKLPALQNRRLKI